MSPSDDGSATGQQGTGSQADRAYAMLREQIVTVELAPSAVFREDDLASRVGIGRTPVREALQRLNQDGFVVILPRRGVQITEISITDLAAIYEVRVPLESLSARLAAERCGENDRLVAAELMARIDDPPDGYREILALDRRIHSFVYRCSRNEFLAATLDHYHDLSLRILYAALRRFPELTGGLADGMAGQRILLDSISRGDSETAVKLSVEHVAEFGEHIRRFI